MFSEVAQAVKQLAREHFLWPENVGTWAAWQAVQTQWRFKPSGSPAGLDYAGVRACLDELEYVGDQRRDAWSGIQACERATLDVTREHG